ncbi:aldo/keto reductase [Thermobaculum terrenum ATCC BAA-798]|uniref:Aldo/keto reductase n=1 Tax=Thermobaculum terrenum (strain ATCC BAA-798 / CCMEE 7001 / YNP1) TaxID=525904 RepID=D1CB32_THET1|nr:aldo/keto reductase [Thermobaculum terrenum]ACZ41997.1 aldo/keto reductase [Thermobaculum terrenum ATCC BAA-798]
MIGKQTFGRTGHPSSRVIFGAAALSNVTQEEADRTMETIIEYGVNHIDTAASYGESEKLLGPWMEKHRNQFFLATKTEKRTFQEAYDQIHRSLERLRVNQVDLIQLHNLVDPEEWNVAMGPGGALEAAIRAKEEGLVRFIGVTGHGLTVARMHIRSLERYDFDSVLLPYNYPLMQNTDYARDFEELLAICKERNVAVQTIKSITQAPWGDQPRTAATWYAPLTEQEDIDLAVWWVLSRPGIFLNSVGDINLLPKVLDAADRFTGQSPTEEEMQRLVIRRHMEPLFV